MPTRRRPDVEGKALLFGGEMIDEASRKMALKFVSREIEQDSCAPSLASLQSNVTS